MTLDAVLDAWGWSDPVPIAATPTSGIFRVRRPGGETAVVKALTPAGDRGERIGADFLAWRDGRGAVRLLARNGPYLLLEDAGPTSLLDELDALGDDAAIAIAAGVVRTLHASGGPPPLLPSLESHFGSLFARASSDPRLADHADTARAVLGAQRDVQPLHGDLHHANVHRAPRGWLALDPKGLVGDPGYEAANWFPNPLHRDDLCLDPARIRARAAALGPAVGRDVPSVLRWGYAYLGLSAAWFLEDGDVDDAERTLRVATAVRGVLGESLHGA